MSVYSLTLPTLTLILNIAQLGVPTTISKLIAKRKYSTFKIIQSSLIILLSIDLLVGIFYIILVPSIANEYLKNSFTIPTLYGMVFLLPIISINSILKGYFIGKNKIDIVNKCQISEEISRLLFIVIFIDFIHKDNVSMLSFFAMFSSIIGEIFSMFHMIKCLHIKNVKQRILSDNFENKKIYKNIINVSLLNTSTRMIGSIIYFFEPIIYTNLMLKANISNQALTLSYGTINSYVFPILLLPSFFSNSLSMFMLPKLSFNIENKNYKSSLKSFILLTLSSFMIGAIFLITIYLFPSFFTKLIYGKVIGIEYIKKYAFLMIAYFIQAPIHITLTSFDKEKNLLFESIVCNIFKVLMFFFLIYRYQEHGLVISIIASVYLSLIIQILPLYKSFKKLKEKM